MSETPQERAEAARVRRRLLNLGEVIAILAVIISGLTLWNSYRERTNTEAEHAQESAQSAKKAATLILKASPDKEGRTLSLSPRSDDQAIQSQKISFPVKLSLSPAETSSDARIDRNWFASALVDARKQAGIADTPGDARLPVMIETHFLVDGEEHVDRAVYEVGYATSHGFLSGTDVHLRGLSRTGAVRSADVGQKQIDAIWAKRMAVKK
jgi:cytoskeletal protein RodZ